MVLSLALKIGVSCEVLPILLSYWPFLRGKGIPLVVVCHLAVCCEKPALSQLAALNIQRLPTCFEALLFVPQATRGVLRVSGCVFCVKYTNTDMYIRVLPTHLVFI